MVNKKKVKGTTWENDAVEQLNKLVDDSEFRRVPGSGALGSTLGEPLLQGDIAGECPFPRKFRIEAKVGYGGEKQFTLKKEWLDKIREEAIRSYSLPFLVGKFSGARSGVKHFVVLDFDTFANILNEYTKLKRDYDRDSKLGKV